MRKHFLHMFLVVLSVSILTPASASAFEISGWLPHWRSEKSVQSALANIDRFSEVNPFVYTVKLDGSLYENSLLTRDEWTSLKSASRERGIRFIPTVMWGSGETIDAMLSDSASRRAHIDHIVREVVERDFDGIDIDYEAKFARTRDNFSAFLRELKVALPEDKWLVCTIESRTPLDSRFSSEAAIPSDIEFANDFTAINAACDRVRIMAYDQGRIDLKLNKANAGPYIPVADVLWVEKVMHVALQEIDKDKLILGIPTYGYEYDMILGSTGDVKQYSRLWSFNPGYATQVATQLNLTPIRNSAGELFLLYPARLSPDPVIPLPDAVRVMSWSDAEAVRQKVALAQRLGIRGVALFKVDGGEDQGIWDVLEPLNVEVNANMPASTGVVRTALPRQDLQFGMRNEDVRTLQKYLNAQGFIVSASGAGSLGNETTFFGPATRAALARLQKSKGITPAVGYYGPITRSVLGVQ